MKKNIVVFIFIMMNIVPILGQSDSEGNDFTLPNSIQFAITDKLTLGAFDGSIISYTRHISRNNAIRIGFGMTLDNETQNSKRYQDTDSLDYVTDIDDKITEYEILIQYLYYSRLRNKIQMYIGIGPIYKKSNTDYESVRKYYPNLDIRHSASNVKSSGVGITTSFGCEWRMNDNISFIAEYGFSVIRGKSETINETKYEYNDFTRIDESDSKYTKIEPRSINFGLSFYF